jgi:hypothetical protein
MSSLRKRQGFFFSLSSFIMFLTYKKLSCMLRVLIKELYFPSSGKQFLPQNASG